MFQPLLQMVDAGEALPLAEGGRVLLDRRSAALPEKTSAPEGFQPDETVAGLTSPSRTHGLPGVSVNRHWPVRLERGEGWPTPFRPCTR